MPVNASNFLQSAKDILDAGSSEMSYRNACSRAYYAAYHSSIDLGRLCPEPADDNVGMHQYLINKLEQIPQASHPKAPQIRSVGYMLKAAKDLRVASDYRLCDEFEEVSAREAVAYAEKIEQRISSILDLDPKSEIAS